MSSSDTLRARGWSCLTEDSHGSGGGTGGGGNGGGDARVGDERSGRSASADTTAAGRMGAGEDGDSSDNDSAGQFADAPEDGTQEPAASNGLSSGLGTGRDGEAPGTSTSPPPKSQFPVFTPPTSLLKRARSDDERDSDEDMFRVDPPRGERRGGGGGGIAPLAATAGGAAAPPDRARMLAVARSRLSKWASRLSDPDRPKLVQPPQSIPLNDEFLQAFGRRVQQDTADSGKAEEVIDKAIGDDDDDRHSGDDDDPENDDDAPEKDESRPTDPSSKRRGAPPAKPKPAALSDRKVKVSNLRYTTTAQALLQACQRAGEVEEVNLIMDDDSDRLNKGRAYVTFADAAGAHAFLQQGTVLDGRTVRVALANENPLGGNKSHAGGGGAGAGGSAAMQSRYWLQDLATKCFRCGQVGHMEKDCPNAAPPKPCPLCAMTTHDLRECPVKATCFNCGLSGHVGRDCPTPRGRAVQRLVCTICLQSGHHRLQCRQGNAVQHLHRANARSAVCMVCHQPGHYCCKENKWFYGLDTLTCSNCGRVGHAGFQCDRPRLDVCSRAENSYIVQQEIERAGTWTTAEEHFAERQLLAKQQQQERGRGRGRPDARRRGNTSVNSNVPNDAARRAKSLPPQRFNNNSAGRGNHQFDPSYHDGYHESNRRDSYNRGNSFRSNDSGQYPYGGGGKAAAGNGQRNHGNGNSDRSSNGSNHMSSPAGNNKQKRSRWR